MELTDACLLLSIAAGRGEAADSREHDGGEHKIAAVSRPSSRLDIPQPRAYGEAIGSVRDASTG